MDKPDYEGYNAYMKDLRLIQMSNAETYDKALLTLSSAFLGISLTFISNVVSLSEAYYLFFLYFSWSLFALTIILTIFSLIFSQWVNRELQAGAKKYFLEGIKEENKYSETLSRQLDKLNTSGGVCFILAVLSITLFVSINIGGPSVTKDKAQSESENRGQPVPTFDQAPKKPPQEPSQNPAQNPGEQPTQAPKNE